MFGIQTAHAAEGLSIKLAPYVLGDFYGMPITATLVTTWVVMVLLIVAAVLLGRRLSLRPSKLQATTEMLIGGVYDYVADTLESTKMADRYFAIILTIFIFILSLNWFGLLPGVTAFGIMEGHGEEAHLIPFLYPPATDLNITLAFSVIAMVVIWGAGIVGLGLFRYLNKFINFHSPIGFVVGIIELISEIGRLIAFAFRLFGNIFAGKTLLLVAMFFVPVILPVPIMAYEVFVGFIQAAVFAFLTLVFIKLATTEMH